MCWHFPVGALGTCFDIVIWSVVAVALFDDGLDPTALRGNTLYW